MTALAPNRSSRRPATIVDTPATTLAMRPKIMTSLEVNPKPTAARMPPNAKTPARPSR